MSELLDGKHTAMMLAVVFFATFMDGLDGSIVNVALPIIGADFSVDTATISWISIIYMMILAGTLVTFARIAADTGVRRIMVIGLAVFTVGSLLCGISSSLAFLIGARIIQAVGAGMMAATGPMCCTEHLPVTKLGFGLSIVTIGASLGFAIGPAVGGAILGFTSWHWIFLINIPIGLVAVPLMMTAIPAGEDRGKCILDVKGAVSLFAAITLITFSIETLSYPDMRLVSAITGAASVATLIFFATVEKRSENPLIKVGMFGRVDFSSIFICLMLVNMTFMGILYLLPFYGEICLGMSSFTIGLFLMYSGLVTGVLGMPFARWSDRTGRRNFCVAAGLLAFSGFVIAGLLAKNMNTAILLVVMTLMGLAWACVGGPMASRLVEHAGDERDMASSLSNEGYYVGGAIGTALVAMLFTIFSGTDGIDIQYVTSEAFLDGFVPTACIVALLCLAISALSFWVKDDR